jgi:hypothetical protein
MGDDSIRQRAASCSNQEDVRFSPIPCLSRADPFRLESDTVQWSVVIARSGECIQGLRGKTMILESVSVVEQPKTGQVVLHGHSFRYSAGPEAGSDSFRLVIVGSSMRMKGTSTVRVEVQVR